MFTWMELIELPVTILVLGYIFSHLLRAPHTVWELHHSNQFFNWADVKYSMMVVAPAVILHEFGHKFASLFMGFPATFHGMLTGGSFVLFGSVFGIVLRLIGSSFVFFIPGYVSPAFASAWDGMSSMQLSILAFAGPAVNLLLWGVFSYLLKSRKYPKYMRMFYISKQINLWLFVFNMLPIPPLDGSKVFSGLFKMIF